MLVPLGTVLADAQWGMLIKALQGVGMMSAFAGGYYAIEHAKKVPPFAPYNLRLHTFLQGKTGTGKTTFLINLAREMIDKGYGVLWLDTHDQAWRLLGHISEKDWDRVVLIRPQDSRFIVCVNLIESFTNSPNEIEELSGEFVSIMKKANPTSWGSNIEGIVFDAVMGLLCARYCDKANFGEITTLDVERVLTDPQYRTKVVKANKLNYIVNQGLEDIDNKIRSDSSLASAVNKFRAWLRNTYLMHFLCNPNGLNLRDAMNSGKIIICNFDSSPTELGEINSQAISSIMVSKLKQVAMARKESDNFFLCIFDEFQTYCHNESFLQMVTECRKKNVGLVLACQSLGGQVATRNPMIAQAMDQCANHIYFRLGYEDSIKASKMFEDERKTGKGFNKFCQQAFLRLPNYTAISMRMGHNNSVFMHKCRYPNDAGGSKANAKRIKELSDHKYATSKVTIKSVLQQRNVGGGYSWPVLSSQKGTKKP